VPIFLASYMMLSALATCSWEALSESLVAVTSLERLSRVCFDRGSSDMW
jgi:hypothetical protein